MCVHIANILLGRDTGVNMQVLPMQAPQAAGVEAAPSTHGPIYCLGSTAKIARRVESLKIKGEAQKVTIPGIYVVQALANEPLTIMGSLSQCGKKRSASTSASHKIPCARHKIRHHVFSEKLGCLRSLDVEKRVATPASKAMELEW